MQKYSPVLGLSLLLQENVEKINSWSLWNQWSLIGAEGFILTIWMNLFKIPSVNWFSVCLCKRRYTFKLAASTPPGPEFDLWLEGLIKSLDIFTQKILRSFSKKLFFIYLSWKSSRIITKSIKKITLKKMKTGYKNIRGKRNKTFIFSFIFSNDLFSLYIYICVCVCMCVLFLKKNM